MTLPKLPPRRPYNSFAEEEAYIVRDAERRAAIKKLDEQIAKSQAALDEHLAYLKR